MEKIPIVPDALTHLTKSLRSANFFANLTMGDFERITAFVQLYAYKPGETVFKQGQTGDAIFVVHQGELEVSVKKAFFLPGRRVGQLSAGELFGETALIDRSPRTATVTAKTAAQLFVIFSSDFDKVVELNPAFGEVVKRLSTERKFQSRTNAS